MRLGTRYAPGLLSLTLAACGLSELVTPQPESTPSSSAIRGGKKCPPGMVRIAGICVLVVCGDAACNGSETCTSCPNDCGACPAVCGDGSCNGAETCSGCASDCGTCGPSVEQLELEAELGALSGLATVNDATASGAKYITTLTATSGTATYALTARGGTYVVWARVVGASSTSDSFFVSMDSGAEDVFDIAEGTWSSSWQWSRVNGRAGGAALSLNPRTFDLSSGSHTLAFRGREAGARLDRLIITNDLDFVPEGETPPPLCGDGTCNGTETCSTCAGDCGACAPQPTQGFYVAPNGSASGDGSLSRPWDLQTALNMPSAVGPGDTIWLRGGTYNLGYKTSYLSGAPDAPVILRQYPGEHAIINGGLTISGSDAWYWGFEITNTNTSSSVYNLEGIDAHAARTKFINLVIHEQAGVGMGLWEDAPDAEANGCVIYNNGWHGSDFGSGHGVYAQNVTGTKLLQDNIVFQSSYYGFHLYGQAGHLDNFTLDGNVAFVNGVESGGCNMLVGGGQPIHNLVVRNTMIYELPGRGVNGMWLGYSDTQNVDAVAEDNLIAHGAPALRVYTWSSFTLRRNTIIGNNTPGSLIDRPLGTTSGLVWNTNTWHTNESNSDINWGAQAMTFTPWKQATGYADSKVSTKPTTNVIRVRPSPYENGRANIVVYNWAGASSVAVDLSSVLAPGDAYAVHHVYDVWGTPRVSGTYAGGTVSIPMSGVAPPVGLAGVTPPNALPNFAVFVVTKSP
jgi:hypothetical protein